MNVWKVTLRKRLTGSVWENVNVRGGDAGIAERRAIKMGRESYGEKLLVTSVELIAILK